FSSPIASRRRSAARTARSASSSWATGAPKTAITASPTNFSIVPPKRSISCFIRAWYGRRTARTSSGSARSERPVNPTRSTKRTDTTFRSSAGSSAVSRAVPHERQKRARSGFSSPQAGQVSAMREVWRRHGFGTSARVFPRYRRSVDEARAVIDRLDRIEALERDGAPPGALIAELRGLVQAAEEWARAGQDGRAAAA